jgi:VanZ family protein
MAERAEARLMPAIWVGSLLAVVLVSLWPAGGRVDEAIGIWWNVGHIPAYGTLTLLTLLVVARRFPLTPGRLLWLGLGLFLLGMLMEVLQPYFGRSADIMDVLDNMVGILLAMGIFYLNPWSRGIRRRAE